MKCDFSFEHYREILITAKNAGYKSHFFHEKGDKKEVLVRHDVDLDLDASLEMAKIEAEENIKATYFIWMGSPFYNIFENKYRVVINQIVQLGHEIGLHFDETAYEYNSREELIKYIDIECDVLKKIFGLDIKVVSFHRPSQMVLEGDLDLGKYFNTYSQTFFKSYNYISDSKGMWKNGCPCHMFMENSPEKIQLLTHPIWWKKNSLNNQERLFEFLGFKLRMMNDELSNNIKSYNKKRVGVKEQNLDESK